MWWSDSVSLCRLDNLDRIECCPDGDETDLQMEIRQAHGELAATQRRMDQVLGVLGVLRESVHTYEPNNLSAHCRHSTLSTRAFSSQNRMAVCVDRTK